MITHGGGGVRGTVAAAQCTVCRFGPTEEVPDSSCGDKRLMKTLQCKHSTQISPFLTAGGLFPHLVAGFSLKVQRFYTGGLQKTRIHIND